MYHAFLGNLGLRSRRANKNRVTKIRLKATEGETKVYIYWLVIFCIDC